jgi:hypothetical protein
VVTGFEADIDGGPLGAIAGLSEGEDFGVRLAGTGMEAFADNVSSLDNHRPHHGIGGGLSPGPPGEAETTLHYGAIEGTGHRGKKGKRQEAKGKRGEEVGAYLCGWPLELRSDLICGEGL